MASRFFTSGSGDGMNIPTYEELRDSGVKPRVHGNGFLQLDLPDGRRFHVWDETLPRQKTRSSIHDHAFGFDSTVICGKLRHIEYAVIHKPKGFYDICKPQRRPGTEDTKLQPTGERVNVVVKEILDVFAGQSYHFGPLLFHDTICENFTATVLTKYRRINIEPRVLVPHGMNPDNDFDRDAFDPELLWVFVKKVYQHPWFGL